MRCWTTTNTSTAQPPEVKARCCHSAQRQTTQRCVSLSILDSVSRPQWWLQSCVKTEGRSRKTSTRWINGSHRGPGSGRSSSNPPTFLGQLSEHPNKNGGKALLISGQTDSHHTPHLPCHSFDSHAIIPSQASAPKTAAEKKDWKYFSHESNGNPSSQPDKAYIQSPFDKVV